MIDLYTKPNCSYCVQAKNLLNRKHQLYREIPIDERMLNEIWEKYPTARTAPVVVVDGEYIGGYKELQALFESNPQLLTE
jgi:glutaredoxin